MTKLTQTLSGLQVAAVLIIAAGWGWINGNFIPDDGFYFYNALIHCIPLALLLVLALWYFRTSGSGRSTIGLTIFACISLIGVVVMIVLGATNPDPNAVGVKTLPDWFAALVQASGSLLWLVALIPARVKEVNRASIQSR